MSNKYYILGVIWVLVIVAALITHSFLPAYAKEQADLYEPYEYSQMYLENEPYSEVIIEYDYMGGQEPDETAIQKLEETIEKNTDKESVDSVIDDQISTTDTGASYDKNDISNLKEEYQDNERHGNQVPIHVIYLNGVWEDNDNVLGLSQRPGQIVIFKSVIGGIEGDNALESGDIEAPVLVHEFGHLLSLVAMNYESDHEDSEYSHHCDESAGECVMAGSVEIKEEMTDPPPIEFCELCEEDMEYISELEAPFGLGDAISYSAIAGQYMIGIWMSVVLVDKVDEGKKKGYEQNYGYGSTYQQQEKMSSEDQYRKY